MDGTPYRPAIVAGRYRIEEVIRQTDTHDVVVGIDHVEDRAVVLKRLRNPERTQTTRLRNVQRALSGLRHPSLMTVMDLVEGKRDAWLVSERCPGVDLIEYWSRLPLEDSAPFDERWEYARPILVSLFDGLEALHRAQIAHLDLKPTNVRVDDSGRAVLVDIGLGAGLRPDSGEVGYLAPELLDGLYVSRMADQWSLGALIYRLLAGRAPIEGATRAELDEAYAAGEVVPIREYRPETPRKIEDIVLRMLRWEPDARYESIGAAWAAFGESLGKAPIRPAAVWAVEPPPLVGRDGLVNLFSRQLLRLKSGRSAVIQLEDGPGSGKSRMLEAWAELARSESDVAVHLRACLPGAPHAILGHWFRPKPGPAGQSVETLVQGVLDGFAGPVVLLLDNIEAVADSTWTLLLAIADLISREKNQTPILMVLSARSLPVKGRLDPAFRVLLPALSEADVESLMRPGGEGDPDVGRMARRIVEKSRGRPDRVMAEVLKAERHGDLVREGRRWVPRIDGPASPLLLPPAALGRLFSLLAEVSRPLPVGLLLQCAPLDRVEVVEVLSFATEQNLVEFRCSAGRWWVNSATPTDSNAVPEYPTAKFHARAAAWFERNYLDDTFAEVIGHHHRHAGHLGAAGDAFRSGAKSLMAVGEESEAKRLLQLAQIYAALSAR
jgi:hypothetical protein